ncbi:unnamed protein product [Arctia plantaginis]|uniref:Uncharacterized protein n=1 Tax=Arctia plantaginis TaxID=874455 RepID=A0A8S0Z4Q9_ARCPL|nr:unnamed protein product [Arctia plantaginis]CAB3228276.1 unnamed protein product [Arctia plantaginis]
MGHLKHVNPNTGFFILDRSSPVHRYLLSSIVKLNSPESHPKPETNNVSSQSEARKLEPAYSTTYSAQPSERGGREG